MKTSHQPCLIGSLYRPPGCTVSYWDSFEALLSKACSPTTQTILCGDFNVDTSRNCSNHMRLADIATSYGLQQHVRSPTRIGLRGPPTTIDLVYSTMGCASPATTHAISFSDHHAVTTPFNMVPIRIPPAAPAQTRNIRRINMDLFRQDIQCANLCSMKGTCTEMWTQWHECLMSLVDQHAPLRPRKHRAHNVAPWYTSELAALVRRRNKLHRKWLRTRLDVDYRSFQQSRREVTRTSRALKEQHYNEAFVNATGNPRQTWRVLNQLSGRQPVHTLPKCSPDDIGNVFAGIVNDPQRPPALTLPQGPMSPNSLSIFKPVTIARVRKLLSSIAMTKATGSDGLPGTILKSCADLLAPSLMLIFNKSLSEGQLPPNMKIANITPVYKGGDPSQPTNYRPVSLLPIVSKLLERIVHEQLSQYLAEHNLYPSCQFGFRRQHSTEDALTMVTDKFLRARDDGLSTGAAFLDMSKAFDKVQHQTLVEDLFQLGISGTALNWLSDYLSNRQQQVVISGDSSSSFTCSSGVPQGSVLGPLLFVIYVRDVASEVDQFAVQVTQFADDIMLHDSRKDKVVLSHNLSSAITHLSNWLGERNLILNSRKTQILFIPANRHDDKTLNVHCAATLLQQVTSAKYLGLHIDDDLKWNTMVDHIAKTVSSKIAILFRHRQCLPMPCRSTYLRCIILPTFQYACNSFSSSLSSAQRDRLEKLLKRAVRVACSAPFLSPTAPLFERLSIQPLQSMYCRKLLLLTFRVIHNNCSVLLHDLVTPLSHTRRTRSTDVPLLLFPRIISAAATRSPSYQCPALWNKLPASIRSLKKPGQFRTALLPHLKNSPTYVAH